MKNFLIGVSLLMAGSGMLLAQSSYIAPKPNQLMFQVDRLPIDKGTRVWLSTQLTTLAKRENSGVSKEQRLTAQLLMLAMRLDAGNQVAKDMNQTLAVGGAVESVDMVESAKAASKINNALKNLSSTEEQSEAQVLANYLRDVLYGYDSENVELVGHELNFSRWKGILPEPAPVLVNPETSKIESVDLAATNGQEKSNNELAVENTNKVPEEPKESYTKWNPHQSTITLRLPIVGGIGKPRVELVDLKTVITPQEALDSKIELNIVPSLEPYQILEFKKLLEAMMKNRFGEFQSVKIEISSASRLHPNTRGAITLPLCLQLMASEKNIKIKRGVKVLGRLEGNKIKRTWDSWLRLKVHLPQDAASGRLIVPAQAEPDLRQLIALKEESFFIRNEVLKVTTVEEAIQLLGESENTDFKEASLEFAKIQQFIGTKSVGPYAVNKQIRKRLELILRKKPNHLSAKMILLRGDPSRNRRLERYYIATEALMILNKLSWLSSQTGKNLPAPNYFEGIIKEIDTFKEEYKDLVSSRDRDLISYLTNISKTFEVIIRNKKKNVSKTNTKNINEAIKQFVKQYTDAKTSFSEATKTLPIIVK